MGQNSISSLFALIKTPSATSAKRAVRCALDRVVSGFTGRARSLRDAPRIASAHFSRQQSRSSEEWDAGYENAFSGSLRSRELTRHRIGLALRRAIHQHV